MHFPAPPQRDAASTHRWLRAVLCCALCSLACTPKEAAEPGLTKVPHFPLELAIPDGWVLDSSDLTEDPAKGGSVLKLVRKSQVTGSPRIDFSLSPLTTAPQKLEAVARLASGQMTRLQQQSQFTPQGNSERKVTFAGHPAIRLEQSYTLGSNSTEVAVAQFSIVTVINERGLIITSAGRRELFTPLASELETLLKNVKATPTP